MVVLGISSAAKDVTFAAQADGKGRSAKNDLPRGARASVVTRMDRPTILSLFVGLAFRQG